MNFGGNIMKIKKIATFCMAMFMAFCLVGCGEAKTSHAVGNNLNKSVDNLSNIIEKLEEVNYNDIVINNINPFADNTFNTVSTKANTKSKWYTVGAIGAEKPSNNAKYVNANTNTEDAKIGVSSTEQNSQNGVCNNGNCYGTTNTASAYKPKYVNNVSNTFVRTSIDSYIANIEVLYNNCADCISCEAECKNAKTTLCQNINDCKVLCQKLKDGTISLSQQEILNCNQNIKALNDFAGRLNTTKGNIKTKVSNINKIKNSYNTQISSVKQAYNNLLDALETRLDCYNDCNNTLLKIQDTINKTNVNIGEAEKNKSYNKDINNNYLQNKDIANTGNNMQKQNVQNNNMQNNNNIQRPNTNPTNTQNNNVGTNNVQPNNAVNMAQNTPPPVKTPMEELNMPNTQAQNTTQNTTQNATQKTTTNYAQSTTQNPVQGPTQNTTQTPQITNNSNPNGVYNQNYNNGTYNNGTYNNGIYNNGVNAYPPRNIDTYHNINKNIDTYRPQTPIYNGTYSNQYPVNNNNNLKVLKTDNKTGTASNTDKPEEAKNTNETAAYQSNNHQKNILDKQIIEHQKKITEPGAEIAYPYNVKKQDVKAAKTDNQNSGIMTLEEPIVNADKTDVLNDENTAKKAPENTAGSTMQQQENAENTNQNTTMQSNNTDKKLKANLVAGKQPQLTKDIKQKPKESEFERNQKTDNATDIKYGMRKKILS